MNKNMLALGLAAGLVAVIAMSNKSGGTSPPPPPSPGPTKPAYWVSPPYPSFPPTWWLSSWDGQYVLMTNGTTNMWIFPADVQAYLDGGWTIVP